MKRGTTGHPKTIELAKLLGVARWGAVGILESLWHFTAMYSPRGDIGQHAPDVIATSIGWEGDPDALMKALVDARWVDACDEHGLHVHDWPGHADQAVHRCPAVAGTKAEQKERGFVAPGWSTCYVACKNKLERSRTERVRSRLPEPLPEPVAGAGSMPEPVAAPAALDGDESASAGVVGGVDARPTDTLPAAEAWARVLAAIEARVNRNSFATWFRPSCGDSVLADRRALVVSVPNQEFVDWIRMNYSRAVADSLSAAGLPGWTVRFVVDRAPPLPEATGAFGLAGVKH
jgi:hypothetical protein